MSYPAQVYRFTTVPNPLAGRNQQWPDLALRKDADPDIPILREAKAEYAKLQ